MEAKAGDYFTSCGDARAAGYSCAEAKQTGYSCAEAKQAGYVEGLKQAGYSCAEAKQAGYPCAEAKQAGFSPSNCHMLGSWILTRGVESCWLAAAVLGCMVAIT